MYIGTLAKLTGATPRAIRLYENMGLIPAPHRKGTYRYYDEAHVELITMIKDAQQLGFKLSEIKALSIHTTDGDEFPWAMAAGMVRDKIMAMDREIHRMKEKTGLLNDLLNKLENRTCRC